jgi:hypothetical protein
MNIYFVDRENCTPAEPREGLYARACECRIIGPFSRRWEANMALDELDPCQDCCEHDFDDNQCSKCGKDGTEDAVVNAEFLSDLRANR